MKPWRLKVKFSGNAFPKEYVTDDVRINPGWSDEVFNQPIEQIEFKLPTGHTIHMAGYEQYNFFAECSEPLGGGPAKIEAFYLAGKTKDLVDLWRIGGGTVVRDRKPWGKEWGGGPTRGWKVGLHKRNSLTEIKEG